MFFLVPDLGQVAKLTVRLFMFWGVRLFTLPATLGSPLVHVAGKNSPLVHIAGNIDKRTVAGHTKFTFTHHR